MASQVTFRKSMSVLFISLLVSILMQCSTGEKFTALKDLEKILHAENGVARDLRDYIAQEEARLGKLRQIADDFEKHSAEALSDPDHHLGNPVNAFLLVKRFTTDWENVLNSLIRSNSSEIFIENLSYRTNLFPDQEDLSGAATALMRLQDTYALPTDKIARGDLQGVKKSPVLSAEECAELGRHTYNEGDYYHTVLWMEQALERWEEEDPKTMEKATILDYLAFSTSMQGNERRALELTKELVSLDPGHIRAQNNLRYYEQMIQEAEEERRKKGDEGNVEEEFTNKRQLNDYRASEEFQTYEALCRGEETHHRPDRHKLYCSFKRHHPVFYIRPLREEIMNFDPFIAIYHDLMTDGEVAKVQELAGPRLNRATVQNPLTGNLETAYYRISKSAWLRDEEDKLINRISQKSAALVNLTLDTVEELQVVNYGIGGHYEPHYDFARKDEISTFAVEAGNRILTAIYYMTDVEAGGYTVFTSLGVYLKPSKGSCAVWWNLKKSGEGNYETRHAGCPVLTGNKWVCNKWFHERGQEFIRPCGLAEEE